MDSDINSSLEHSAQVRLKLLRMNEIVNTIHSYNILCNSYIPMTWPVASSISPSTLVTGKLLMYGIS